MNVGCNGPVFKGKFETIKCNYSETCEKGIYETFTPLCLKTLQGKRKRRKSHAQSLTGKECNLISLDKGHSKVKKQVKNKPTCAICPSAFSCLGGSF